MAEAADAPPTGDVGGGVAGGVAPAEAKVLYDRWGADYTPTVVSWGYDMPRQIARRLAARTHVLPRKLAVLDAGAGDGLSGVELRRAGLTPDIAQLTAADLSPKLLQIAAGRQFEGRDVYDRTLELDLTQPLPFASGAFDAVACVGTFTYLPPDSSALDELVRVTAAGGHVAYNVRCECCPTPTRVPPFAPASNRAEGGPSLLKVRASDSRREQPTTTTRGPRAWMAWSRRASGGWSSAPRRCRTSPTTPPTPIASSPASTPSRCSEQRACALREQ